MKKLLIATCLLLPCLLFGQGKLDQATGKQDTLTGVDTTTVEFDIGKNTGVFELLLLVADIGGTVTDTSPDEVDIKYVGCDKFDGTTYCSVNDTVTVATDTTISEGLMNFEVNQLEEFHRVKVFIYGAAGDTMIYTPRLNFSGD